MFYNMGGVSTGITDPKSKVPTFHQKNEVAILGE